MKNDMHHIPAASGGEKLMPEHTAHDRDNEVHRGHGHDDREGQATMP